MGAGWVLVCRRFASLVVVLAMLGVALSEPTMAAGSGSISGVVRNDLGEPLDACSITVTRDEARRGGYGLSAGDGTFTVTGLSAGTYRVQVNCPTAVGVAKAVEVRVDEHVTGVDFLLDRYAVVTGSVTDGGGVPVSGACVWLRGEVLTEQLSARSTSTDGTGSFTIDRIPPGSYRLLTRGCPTEDGTTTASPPIGQTYLGGSSTFAAAEVVTLGAGDVRTLPTVAAAASATVTGTITLSSGASLSSPVCVEAYPGRDALPSATTWSALDGTFALSGLGPGPHDLRFCRHRSDDPEIPDHQPQWYPASPDRAGTSSIEVPAGGALGGVDVMLGSGGSIVGRITDTEGAGTFACVSVSTPAGAFVAGAVAFQGQDYAVTGLAEGTYRLHVEPGAPCAGERDDLLPEYYPDAARIEDAADIEVLDGTATRVDVVLEPKLDDSIRGTVRGPGQRPAVGVCVRATGPDGTITYAETGADGHYGFSRLERVPHQLAFDVCGSSGPERYEPEYWEDALVASDAVPLVVTDGPQQADATLAYRDQMGIVDGVVTTLGEPTAGECVAAFSTYDPYSPLRPLATARTASDGSYVLAIRLPQGGSTAGFETPPRPVKLRFGCGPTVEWHHDQPGFADADPVTVSAAAPTTVDADLTPLGEVNGRVVVDDQPIGSSCVRFTRGGVQLATTTSSSDGSYRIKLPIGTYEVSSCDVDLVPVWFDGADSSSAATPVVVTVGTTTPGVDLRTTRKSTAWARATGTVRAEPGTTACVELVAADTAEPVAQQVVSIGLDGSGRHESAYVPPGRYQARASSGGSSGCADLRDVTYHQGGEAIVLPAGAMVTGIDIDLRPKPVVTVLSPAPGDTVRGPTSLVAATTHDGAVRSVEFLVDGVPVGVDADPADGWSVPWNPAAIADGQLHDVVAVAAGDTIQASDSPPARVRILSSSTLDFDGDGDTDIGVYRPATSTWHLRGASSEAFGSPNAVPVPGDYDGDGRTDRATYRATSGQWDIEGLGTLRFGPLGGIPVPADYDGDGDTDLAVFTPSTAQWDIRGLETTSFGPPGSVPVPADYDGDGDADLGTYAPTTGAWAIRGLADVVFGGVGAAPVPADYDGDGDTDIATFRTATARWQVRGITDIRFGVPGDVPLPADYDGDGDADLATFRPTSATWTLRGTEPFTWGQVGDRALAERH
jgi:hypothetical protein